MLPYWVQTQRGLSNQKPQIINTYPLINLLKCETGLQMWFTGTPETSVYVHTHNYRVVGVWALCFASATLFLWYKGKKQNRKSKRNTEAHLMQKRKKKLILSLQHETSSRERKNESKERERSRMKEHKSSDVDFGYKHKRQVTYWVKLLQVRVWTLLSFTRLHQRWTLTEGWERERG